MTSLVDIGRAPNKSAFLRVGNRRRKGIYRSYLQRSAHAAFGIAAATCELPESFDIGGRGHAVYLNGDTRGEQTFHIHRKIHSGHNVGHWQSQLAEALPNTDQNTPNRKLSAFVFQGLGHPPSQVKRPPPPPRYSRCRCARVAPPNVVGRCDGGACKSGIPAAHTDLQSCSSPGAARGSELGGHLEKVDAYAMLVGVRFALKSQC